MKGLTLIRVEEVFAALLAGEEIVDPGEQSVTSELPGIAAAFQAHSLSEVQAMLEGLAREKVGASHAVEDVGNLYQHVAGIAVGLLAIAGELGAEMADPARGESGGQRKRSGFGGNEFLTIVADGVVGDGAGGIEKDVVGAPVTYGAQSQRELTPGSEIDIKLGIGGIADLCSGIFSGE